MSSPQQVDVIRLYEHGATAWFLQLSTLCKVTYKEVSGRWSGGLRA